MTVHIDRAHHHPRVYKRLGYWQTRCPRCGLLPVDERVCFSRQWHLALVAALCHASTVHS